MTFEFVPTALFGFYIVIALGSFICAIGSYRSPRAYRRLLIGYFLTACLNGLWFASLLGYYSLYQGTSTQLVRREVSISIIGIWATLTAILAAHYVLDYMEDRFERHVLAKLRKEL